MDLTSSDYWTEVESIAKQVTLEARENETDIHDCLHETIDGHQYMIYNAYHLPILQHSSNEDAYFQEMGGTLEAKDASTVFQTLAFYAFMADVSQHSGFNAESEDEDSEDEGETQEAIAE